MKQLSSEPWNLEGEDEGTPGSGGVGRWAVAAAAAAMRTFQSSNWKLLRRRWTRPPRPSLQTPPSLPLPSNETHASTNLPFSTEGMGGVNPRSAAPTYEHHIPHQPGPPPPAPFKKSPPSRPNYIDGPRGGLPKRPGNPSTN